MAENMDHAEAVAKHLFESVMNGARMVYLCEQSKGEHDFDLHHPDGHVSAVEVTASVDRTTEETHAAIGDKKKGGSVIKTTLCKNSWRIFPVKSARISRLRKEADKYLAAIESAGIDHFWGPTASHTTVEAIYNDLGVQSGSVASWTEAGQILIALPVTGGAIDTNTVIEAVKREALKPDNRKKLGAAGGAERHLAIYVSMLNMPWVPLVNFEPPPVLPQLPPEITDIWVFSETGTEHEFVVWRASTSLPWKNQNLSLHISH